MYGIRREIAGVLVIKLMALAVLYYAFFADAPATPPAAVAAHVMGR